MLLSLTELPLMLIREALTGLLLRVLREGALTGLRLVLLRENDLTEPLL